MSDPTYDELRASVERLRQELDEGRDREDKLGVRLGRSRALLEGLGVPFFVCNADHVLVDVNEQACRLLGYEQSELVGQSADIIHASDNVQFQQCHERVLAGEAVTGEFTVHTKEGYDIPVELHCEPVKVDGEPLIVALVHDLSNRRALIRRIVEEERSSAVGTLAAGVAHQFNNLLARIMACAEDALESRPDPDVAQGLRTIINSCDEASQITERLLSYARRRPPLRHMVNLGSILDHTLQILEGDLYQAGIEVVRDYGDVPDMMLDNVQMGQVFMNLIANARDAMPRGGRLTVSCRVERDEAVVRISDTGAGIPEELQGQIFEPFVTTKGALSGSVQPGMGLGLCVCQGIVGSHYGTVDVTSRPGKGSTFTIRLPLDQASCEKDRNPRPIPPT